MASSKEKKNVMIIGAGWTGSMLIERFFIEKQLLYEVKCIIDDDETKIGKYIKGVLIAGDRKTICKNVITYNIQEIIIALPSVSKLEIKDIIGICRKTDCKIKIVPDLYEIDELNVDVTRLRDLKVEDLLGRNPIVINNGSIKKYIEDSVVLITGAGGSIGSELSRQVALNKPAKIVLIDIYENGVYDLQQELLHVFPELNLDVLIASVRNEKTINHIFEKYKFDIVFHAAAHKHVPLMEKSPNESIKNNVFGTYNVAMASGNNKVKKFVLISTDKAVNPTNIMGASKRICEMLVQLLNNRFDKTEFAAVRFGNVLGSNGSVVPLFKRQIMNGGPVTVTHPDIIRYFMTIPEAVSLVLQAGAYASGGEIFVLDMGEPVKILDLARNMIKLSGLSENEIKIEFTGLRPGEKLYEELLLAEEDMEKTNNDLIFIGKQIEFNEELFMKQLEDLKIAAYADSQEIRKIVKEVVSTYSYE